MDGAQRRSDLPLSLQPQLNDLSAQQVILIQTKAAVVPSRPAGTSLAGIQMLPSRLRSCAAVAPVSFCCCIDMEIVFFPFNISEKEEKKASPE